MLISMEHDSYSTGADMCVIAVVIRDLNASMDLMDL